MCSKAKCDVNELVPRHLYREAQFLHKMLKDRPPVPIGVRHRHSDDYGDQRRFKHSLSGKIIAAYVMSNTSRRSGADPAALLATAAAVANTTSNSSNYAKSRITATSAQYSMFFSWGSMPTSNPRVLTSSVST